MCDSSVAHVYWGAQLKESVCCSWASWGRCNHSPRVWPSDGKGGKVELEIQHFKQCYSPTQQLILPWTLEEKGFLSVDWSLPCRLRAAQSVWGPWGGETYSRLRLRWDLSHPWKAGSLRSGSSRARWGQSGDWSAFISWPMRVSLMNSITSPTWPSSSCDPQSKHSVPRSAIKTSLSLISHSSLRAWPFKIFWGMLVRIAGPVRTVSHLIPEAPWEAKSHL